MISRSLAVSIGDLPTGTGPLGLKFPNFASLLNLLLQNVFALVGVILLALLIFGGVFYIINAGGDDPKKLQQAQSIITDALIGFAVVFCAYFVIQIIEVITGVPILKPNF